jgi:hypothetical protein
MPAEEYQLRSKAIKREAERLVRDHASSAIEVAAKAVLLAKRQKNARLQSFHESIMTEITRNARRLRAKKKPASV